MQTAQRVQDRFEPDPHAPWTWTKEDILGVLDEKQRKYVEALPHLFRLKTAHGDVIPYDPEPFQVWYHAHATLPMWPDAPDRIVEKGRGIGYTSMTAMDLLMLAHTLDRVVIPVAGRQGRTSGEFIDRCHDLLRDSHDPDMWDYDGNISRQIRVGESRIIPIAGGNPHSIRSMRCPALCFDEFAFHDAASELRLAARPVLSEGGQLNVISTHNGSDTEFYNLVQESRDATHDVQVFSTPIHDPGAIERGTPVSDQVTDGPLELVAPWLDMSELDTLWKEDPPGYEQENLCVVMDEQIALLARDVVRANTDPGLTPWMRQVDVDDHVRLAEEAATLPTRPDDVEDPLYLGVDFASRGDLSAYALWQYHTGSGRMLQRWFHTLHGVETPDQNDYLRLIDDAVRPRMTLIDMTGPGTGLYEYAVDELRSTVEGVHFASRIPLPSRNRRGEQVKVMAKKAICLHVAAQFHDGTVTLLGDHKNADLQERHMVAVRRADLDSSRKRDEEGHADIFWANALALWGPKLEGLYRYEPEDQEVDLGDYF